VHFARGSRFFLGFDSLHGGQSLDLFGIKGFGFVCVCGLGNPSANGSTTSFGPVNGFVRGRGFVAGFGDVFGCVRGEVNPVGNPKGSVIGLGPVFGLLLGEGEAPPLGNGRLAGAPKGPK
jgi:hypothetical protein